MILVGTACIIAALACIALLVFTTPDFDLAFALAAVSFFFAMGAYASLFRPQNWSTMLNWGATSNAKTIVGHIQNNGFVIGSLVYLAAIVCLATLIIALGKDQLVVAIVLSAPIFLLGLAVHVWSLILKTGSPRRNKNARDV